MRSLVVQYLLLITFTSLAAGQRWVWGSRRSQRQLDLHRPPSLLPPVVPPAATPASPPAAPPFGLVPSASSLNPLGRPAVLESSFSLPVAQPPVSRTPSQLRPRPLEPLVFRPLPIDISKLPLESSSESDSFGSEFHPPLSPLPLLREPVPQDLSRSLSFALPGLLEQLAGIHAFPEFPQEISNIRIRAPSPLPQPQAFISAPDISRLPLQGSSADGSERFKGQPFADNPVGVTKFQVRSPTPSDRQVLFPQKLSSREALNTRNDRFLEGLINSQHSSVTPNPTRVFLQDHPTLNDSPFISSKLTNNKQTFKVAQSGNGVQTPRGIIKFPSEIKNFNLGGNGSPFRVVDAPNFGDEPLASGSVSEVSSYAFPPPFSSLALQQSQSLSELLRTDRSDTASKKPEPKQIKPLTMVFKKHFNTKKGSRVPPYVWLWPEEAKARRASSFFSSPAKHAL